MKTLVKRTVQILIVFVLLEIFLQFYNPFRSRVKNGDVILPKNVKYELSELNIKGLDSHLLHQKNNMGFRGPDWNDSIQLKKIIFMGGSTTECFYLNDNKDWPSVFASKINEKKTSYWVNNAGMDGQSSYGNLVMLKQHVLNLKPDYLILMTGLNDIGLKKPSKYDETDAKGWKYLYNKLELPATIVNLIRANKAKKLGFNHQVLDVEKAEKLNLTDTQIVQRITNELPLIQSYKERIKEIAKLCKENDIKLIFISQTVLFGDENDMFTNANLSDIKVGESNGKTLALLLKQYNKATFEVTEELGLKFVNLSLRLPKDSRFFYDGIHFTNEGSEMVASLIYDELENEFK